MVHLIIRKGWASAMAQNTKHVSVFLSLLNNNPSVHHLTGLQVVVWLISRTQDFVRHNARAPLKQLKIQQVSVYCR